MRLYAIITAVFAAVTIVGFSGAKALAATTKTNNINRPASTTVAAATAKDVTVVAGDNLSEIATENNTTYVRIFDANEQIQDPNLIYPGEILIIPSPSEQLTDRQLPAETIVQPTITSQPAPDNSTIESAPSTDTPTQPSQSSTTDNSVWDSLAQCESGGNWSINTGNGFYGGLQFTLSSWQAVGGSGYPNQASQQEQIMRAEMLQAQQGWGAWPVCSIELGL